MFLLCLYYMSRIRMWASTSFHSSTCSRLSPSIPTLLRSNTPWLLAGRVAAPKKKKKVVGEDRCHWVHVSLSDGQIVRVLNLLFSTY